MLRPFLLAILIFATGCTGPTIVRYSPNDPAKLAEVPVDGMYSLVGLYGANYHITHALRKGDPIGFTIAGDSVIAVAGIHRYAIDTGVFSNDIRWQRVAD